MTRTPNNVPAFKGGQGRDANDIRTTGDWLALLFLVVIVVVAAVCLMNVE